MPDGGPTTHGKQHPPTAPARTAPGAVPPPPGPAAAPPRATPALRRTGFLVTLVLGGLTATPPLAMDMYLPALPAVTHSYGASAATIQLTLTACLAGMALGQLVVGPMSDKWGRRRPLLTGLVLYVLATALCVVAPNAALLVTFRLIQGLAGAAGIVIARAVVRDLYDGLAMARFFSTLMLISGAAPIVAPLIGGQLLRFTDWRGVFAVLTLIGLGLLVLVHRVLPETLAPEDRHSGGFRATLATMRGLLADRPSPATCSPPASPRPPSSPTSPPRPSWSRRSTAPPRRPSACSSASTRSGWSAPGSSTARSSSAA